MESVEASLKKNELSGELAFDPREGRMVRRDEILPSVGKLRSEVYPFLEGVAWLLDHLIGYKANVPDVRAAALEEAKTRYANPS